MKKECVIFLTHNFSKEFLNTLYSVDNDINLKNYEVIVLFDSKSEYYDDNIKKTFKNIQIIKEDLIDSSYDRFGHTMYINFFKKNLIYIKKFKYIWVIENDVYYHGNSILNFLNLHKHMKKDILCSNFGERSDNWCWYKTLKGIKKTKFGLLGVIMRFSNNFFLQLIKNIDKKYFGFFEALIPAICMEYNFTISNFKKKYCGILTSRKDNKDLKKIEKEIINNNFITIQRNKIYHPIKL